MTVTTTIEMKHVRQINHATFAVKNIERSVFFYTNALGLRLTKSWDSGAYLTAGGDWICLSLDENTRNAPHNDYTHMAFDVHGDDFQDIKEQCLRHGAIEWKTNKSEGASFYFLDPDGHKLEIHVGTLETRLKALK